MATLSRQSTKNGGKSKCFIYALWVQILEIQRRFGQIATRGVTTQNNHVFMSIYAVFKLECLKLKHT